MIFPMMAQSNDKKPGLHKENCTFVNKDGKTFNLYGKVKIVESFPDIKVQIVESFEDLDVKIVESFPDQCGKVKLVESFPDVYEPHNLRTRKIGNRIAIEMHIRMRADISLKEAHDRATSIECKLKERFGENSHVTIHTEPVK